MVEKKLTVKNISLIIVVLMLMVLIVFMVGKAFGFFSYAKEGSVVNSITIRGLTVNIDSETDDALNIVNAYPMYDSQGMENEAFVFTVTNNSSHGINYSLLVENDSDKLAECLQTNGTCPELSTDYIRYSYKVNNGTWSSPANLGDNSNIIHIDSINANQLTQFSIKLWIDEDAGNEIQGHYFFGKLVITGEKNTDKTFAQTILNNNKLITDAPTLTTTSEEANENGLYVSYETNTGDPTYYFRGNVDNNYVKFAGQTWRIVRINEDRTVRLIMEDTLEQAVRFNEVRNSIDDIYYSNTDVQNGIKQIIDTWYQGNIVDKGYGSYVATGNYYCEEAKVGSNDYLTYMPTFKCSSDRLLNLNVALLTYDEAVHAGGFFDQTSTASSNFYLFNNRISYLMTPLKNAISSYLANWMISKATGGMTHGGSYQFARPVINLKGNLDVSGSGTETDPYVVGYKVLTTNSYDTLNAAGKVHGATKENGYVSLDGVDDYIDLGLANYDFNDSITMTIKVKFNELNKKQDFFCNWQGGGYCISLEANNKISFYIKYGNNTVMLSSTISLDTDKVYLIVATADSSVAKLYINGNFNTSSNIGNDHTVLDMPFYLGANPDVNGATSYQSNVGIYKVAVFDRALTAKEIQNGFTDDIKIYDDTDLLVYEDFTIK